MTNVSGPQFTWRATFDGSMQTLLVNGKKLRASREIIPPATQVSYVDVVVPQSQSVTVSR